MATPPLAKAVDVQPMATTVEAEAVYLDLNKHTPIPASFIQVACCACRFDYCDFPSCWGCKGNCQICCLEQEGFCCKAIKHEDVCCVCFHDTFECVTFNTAMKCYRQCCCCEVIMGCPLETAYTETEAVHSSIPRSDLGDLQDAIPCSAFCCSITSCYCSFPACLSCYNKGVCCCLSNESACCKMMCCEKNRKKESLCILFEKQNCLIMWPKTCCKTTSQTCCLDSRCAFPCDNEVPCMCTWLPFCTCCVDGKCQIACCQNFKQLLATSAVPHH